jgi:CarD family transcriptional regulator
MYKPGDHVFYPKGGVFVIEKESQKSIAGHSISFFDLISSDAKTRISIPKANVDRVGVRKLVSEQEFDKQIKCWIPDIKISKLHHKNRKSRFETMRQTGTFREMGSVIVTIHYLINKTKATFEEKRIYDQIRKRLVNEIEIIKSMNPSMAETLLQGVLDVAIKRQPPKEEEDLEDTVAVVGDLLVAAIAGAENGEARESKSEEKIEAKPLQPQEVAAAKDREKPKTEKPVKAKAPAMAKPKVEETVAKKPVSTPEETVSKSAQSDDVKKPKAKHASGDAKKPPQAKPDEAKKTKSKSGEAGAKKRKAKPDEVAATRPKKMVSVKAKSSAKTKTPKATTVAG